MQQLPCHTVVFTDLDGTLLNDSYDLDSAAQILNELRLCGVLAVPASSKTAAEMHAFKERLDYDVPLIGENGALLSWPAHLEAQANRIPQAQPTTSYAEICDTLAALRTTYGFKFAGFADMSLDEVATATGLDLHAASLARQRTASEPIRWDDNPERLQALRAQLKQQGLVLVAGGRFLHAMSPVDKGSAARRVLEVLTADRPQQPLVLACGDSPNDMSMLRIADGCLVFPRHSGGYLETEVEPTLKAKAPGVLCWLKGVKTLMQMLDKPLNEEATP